MEIYNKQNKGYIEVWLTNDEQLTVDRNELTEILRQKFPKCKIVFFLSGSGSLFQCAENLLIKNMNTI